MTVSSRRVYWLLLALAGWCVSGCVEPYNGAVIGMLMGSEVTTPCKALAKYGVSGPKSCSTNPDERLRESEDRFPYHYELWATSKRSTVCFLTSFTVQRHLIADEQHEFEKQGVKRSDGNPFKIGWDTYYDDLSEEDQQIAIERMKLTENKYSVTTYSVTLFQPDGITLAENMYVGNHRPLTQPHNGLFLGMVTGGHPYGGGTLGGGHLQAAVDVSDLDSLWVTIESEPPDRDSRRPSSLVYLQGEVSKVARGVMNVKAVSPWDSSVTATFSVIANLEDEEYF